MTYSVQAHSLHKTLSRALLGMCFSHLALPPSTHTQSSPDFPNQKLFSQRQKSPCCVGVCHSWSKGHPLHNRLLTEPDVLPLITLGHCVVPELPLKNSPRACLAAALLELRSCDGRLSEYLIQNCLEFQGRKWDYKCNK